MKLRIATFLAATVLVTGCTPGTQGYNRLLESNGDVRVEPSNQPGYDYTVYIKNTVDFGYNPSDKPTRDRVATQMLASQCAGAKVVGETTINTGQYLGGRQAITYLVQVDCP